MVHDGEFYFCLPKGTSSLLVTVFLRKWSLGTASCTGSSSVSFSCVQKDGVTSQKGKGFKGVTVGQVDMRIPSGCKTQRPGRPESRATEEANVYRGITAFCHLPGDLAPLPHFVQPSGAEGVFRRSGKESLRSSITHKIAVRIQTRQSDPRASSAPQRGNGEKWKTPWKYMVLKNLLTLR